MSRLVTLVVAAVVGLFPAIAVARGQSPDTSGKRPPTAADSRDSVFLRARKLVLEGNGAAGRALVDSAITATTGTPDYASALYWRGALSSTAAGAERDYRRVIVEYPFSPHSGDALLALAQLEMARGEREPAIDHLQRFLLQRPDDPERVRAGIWLGRMLLEQNQPAKGCAVLLRTRASLGDSAVEMRNQVDYYAARCDGVDTTTAPARKATAPPAPPPRAESTAKRPRPATRDSARGDSVKRQPVRREAPSPAAGRFTVQVAAFDTRQAAEQLIAKLGARGIVARLVPSQSAPYRVRVGRYATDGAAAAAARDLKDKGIVGFVTTTDNESTAATVRR
jgi:SPOR domain/Tetratricopeptide repeat